MGRSDSVIEMNENLPAASVCTTTGVGFSALCDVLTGFANFTASTPEAAALAPAAIALFASSVMLATSNPQVIERTEDSETAMANGGSP